MPAPKTTMNFATNRIKLIFLNNTLPHPEQRKANFSYSEITLT